MTLINKCANEKCNEYTIMDSCPKCESKVKSAHYKFDKLPDAPPRS